jgi:hypothetical protein
VFRVSEPLRRMLYLYALDIFLRNFDLDETIKFPSNVLLIDAAFLNSLVTDLKTYLRNPDA